MSSAATIPAQGIESSSSSSLNVDFSTCGFNFNTVYIAVVDSISAINDITVSWNTTLTDTANNETAVQNAMNDVTSHDTEYLQSISNDSQNKITKASSQLSTDTASFESAQAPYTNAISNDTSLTSSLSSSVQSLLSQLSSYLEIFSQLASLLA